MSLLWQLLASPKLLIKERMKNYEYKCNRYYDLLENPYHD